MELTALDLKIALQVFPLLESIACIDDMGAVEIKIDTQGVVMTIGYGESGNPAIIGYRDGSLLDESED